MLTRKKAVGEEWQLHPQPLRVLYRWRAPVEDPSLELISPIVGSP